MQKPLYPETPKTTKGSERLKITRKGLSVCRALTESEEGGVYV
jgi:hypothetical protein